MAHLVTETDVQSASVTVPNAGELVRAIDVETAVQPIANRTKNHELHGLYDSTKNALGSALVYRLKNGGAIELLSAGAYIFGTLSEFTGAWVMNATLTFAKAVTFAGADARTRWRVSNPTDANSDITTAADRYFLPSTNVANRTRTVRTSGTYAPGDGEVIVITRTKPSGGFGSFTESIVSESGQDLFIFGIGYHGFVELTYRASIADWIPTLWQSVDGTSLAGTGLYGN